LIPSVARLLARLKLRVDPRRFLVVRVPSSLSISMRKALADVHAPFFVQFFAGGQTVVLAEDEWMRVGARFPGARESRGYCLITLEVELEPDTESYLSAVTGALADEGIPAEVLSSFRHDHLLIPHDRLEQAVAALLRLAAAVREGISET
jgi:hypothetical protein